MAGRVLEKDFNFRKVRAKESDFSDDVQDGLAEGVIS